MAGLELDLAGSMALRRGHVALGDAAFPGRQIRLVTAMLLVDRSTPVTVDQLVDSLWPSGPPSQFRPAVRGLVSQLRGLLSDVGVPAEAIHARAGHYVVDLPDLQVDIERAAVAVDEAREALRDGHVDEAIERASTARAVLSRPLLPGVDAVWLDRIRDTLRGRRLESLLVLGEGRLRSGELSGARSVAREAVALEPLREDAWRLAMRVEEQSDNTAAALALYEDLRTGLAEELGVDPSTATRRVHARLLRDDDVLGAQAGRSAAPSRGAHDIDRRQTTNPYVGLRPFGPGDADRFFGREPLVQRLLRRLAAHRGVAVVGPSGVGKSSLVRAGLLPALATGGLPDADLWHPIVMTPGRDPVQALARHVAAALPGVGTDDNPLADMQGLLQVVAGSDDDTGPVLLVVDQAEELFAIAEPDRAERFIDAVLAGIAAPGSPLRLVMTLRADFYERASRHAGLADLLSETQLVVPPLRGDGLQAAITEPARMAGRRLEPGVVGRMVAEVGSDPSGLPLVQHALWRLCQRSGDGPLTLAALAELGGVAGALVEHAEHVWADLDVGQRRVARALLLRGVTPSLSGATAAPVARTDLDGLGPAEVIDAAVAEVVRARLVRTWREDGTGRSLLRLSHETLMTAWPRLEGWIDAQREHLRVAARLVVAAEQWVFQGRHDDWLLTGRRLDDALDLAGAIDADMVDGVLAPVERALVAASAAARDARRDREAKRRALERELHRQSVRHLRTGLALSGADKALEDDPERTLLLCLAVADDVRTHTPQHEGTWLRLLHHGLANHVQVGDLRDVGPLLAVLPDGSLVTAHPRASRDETGRAVPEYVVEVRDRRTGEIARVGDTPGLGRPTVAHVDPTGSHLALGGVDGRIHVLDVETLGVTRVVAGASSMVASVVLSPGGGQVAALWAHRDMRQLVVTDVATGAAVHAPGPSEHQHVGWQGSAVRRALDFHPTQPRLLVATGLHGSVLELFDTTAWSVVRRRDLHLPILEVRHSPDGRQIATTHRHTVAMHDAQSLDQLHLWRIDAPFPAADWLPNGTSLAVAGRTLERVTPPPDVLFTPKHDTVGRTSWPDGHLDRVLLAVPESSELVTGRRDAPGVQRWDGGGDVGAEVVRLTLPGTFPGCLAWAPDGGRLATAAGGTVVVWDVGLWQEEARQVVSETPVPGGPASAITTAVAWTADGGTIVATASGGTLAFLDGETSAVRHVHRFPVHLTPGDVDVAPDGKWVLSTHGPHIFVVDRTHQLQQRIDAPAESFVEAASFSPDGALVAATHWPTASTRPGVQGTTVWDWATAEVVAHRPGLASNLSWAPDGRTLAVAEEGRTAIWDVDRDKVVHELAGHHGPVQDVDHSRDGATIATGAVAGDIRVWDAATGMQRLHLTGHRGVHRLGLHPSRRWIAIATAPGNVHVWTLDTDELLRIVRSRMIRELTDEEYERYLATRAGASAYSSHLLDGDG